MKLAWVLPCCVLLAAGEPALPGWTVAQDPASAATVPASAVAAAIADYRAGRYQPAYEAFAAALQAAGEAAPAVLRCDAALAALRVLRTADAEAALAPLLAAADLALRSEATFLAALAACQRAERAALAARLPDAEPQAWQAATTAMQRSVALFVQAATLRGEWPAALRNAERASRAWSALQREAAAAQPAAAKSESPPPPSPAAATPETEAVAPDLAADRLGPAQLEALRQRVQQQEREKRLLRQQQPRLPRTGGERTW